jgi:hypothetical protein
MDLTDYEDLKALAAELGMSISQVTRESVAVSVRTGGALITEPPPERDTQNVPWALLGTSWQPPSQDDASLPEWHETTAAPWGDDLDGAGFLDPGAES